jgi:hypothetical protein
LGYWLAARGDRMNALLLIPALEIAIMLFVGLRNALHPRIEEPNAE